MAMAIVVQIDQYAIARHDADVLQRHGIGRLRRRRIGRRGNADVGGPGIRYLPPAGRSQMVPSVTPVPLIANDLAVTPPFTCTGA
jgi:hypothetical protein